jgi:hypothetical protein
VIALRFQMCMISLVPMAALTSCDRGFDAAGSQVWGAVTGPYEFRREAAD